MSDDRHRIALIVFALLLTFASLGRWPYFVYTILRLSVCIASGTWAYRAFEHERGVWIWLFAGIALLYNPFFPIRMHRSDWTVVNLLTALLFAASATVSWVTKKRSSA
jgi:hypothetical protein